MSATEDRQFFQRELVEMDNLLQLSPGDPVMAFALKNRRESLQRELQQAQNYYKALADDIRVFDVSGPSPTLLPASS